MIPQRIVEETLTRFLAQHYGEIGAGKVVPFIPQNGLIEVAVPKNLADDREIMTLTVRGCSLEDEGIFDGDVLICRLRFSWSEIDENTICAVFIHSTGELCAKKIIREANMLTLRASGGGIPDKQYSPDEIEIKAIAYDHQRPLTRRPTAKRIVKAFSRRRVIEFSR